MRLLITLTSATVLLVLCRAFAPYGGMADRAHTAVHPMRAAEDTSCAPSALPEGAAKPVARVAERAAPAETRAVEAPVAPSQPEPLDELGRPIAARWADYDARCEQNARFRAAACDAALERILAQDIGARERVEFARYLAETHAFTVLDYTRESHYVPDDGLPHPIPYVEGAASLACGGARYVIERGRFPLYDTLDALASRPLTPEERAAWSPGCPLETELIALHARSMAYLAAYQ